MNKSLHKLLPVLFGFFVMGFCDVVGISTSYVQQDFGLSETLAGFIPSMVFIWFLLLSIPAALAMNRLGRKNMVQISNGITAIGMLIPFVHYNLATCMTAFVLLGIGNTILQVSLNPLLTNVVKGDALTSSLTAGQVVKAVSSFCGPFIAAFAAGTLGNWQYLFPIFALITLLSAAWLMCTPIREEAEAPQASPVGATFALLKDRTVLLLFLGIVFVVGVDVGMNTVAPKLLIERGGYPVEQAGLGSSVYFVCRTVGALIGSILLVRMNDVRYFRIHIFAAIAAMAIVSRIANFTNSVIIGFGQGFQPVCGYNYGARIYQRVRQGFWFCVQVSTVFLIVVSAVEWLLAPGFVELFRKGDPQVVEIGARALRLQCLTFPFFGWLIISNMMMQTMGKAVRASILGIARQGIFLIPFVLILPHCIGILGIQLAQPIADIISCLLAIPLQLQLLREMQREERRLTP